MMDSSAGWRPARRSSAISMTRRNDLLRLRTFSNGSTRPWSIINTGFRFSADPSRRAAPPMRPPRCKNSSVSTAKMTWQAFWHRCTAAIPSSIDRPSFAARCATNTCRPRPMETEYELMNSMRRSGSDSARYALACMAEAIVPLNSADTNTPRTASTPCDSAAALMNSMNAPAEGWDVLGSSLRSLSQR